jgi:hypothetical protein
VEAEREALKQKTPDIEVEDHPTHSKDPLRGITKEKILYA